LGDAGHSPGRAAFLSRADVLFSEEKNQKTFALSPTSKIEAMAWTLPRARDKSLLVLFFRKEHAFF
jgi:hypothetical protein